MKKPGVIPAKHRRQGGVFVILTALMLVVLFGVVGLAIDVARHLVIVAELQNSADACALGAVLDLNGAQDAPKRAAQSGRFIGGLKNKESFQALNVTYADADITFSVSRAGPFVAAASAASNSVFVKCVARQPGLVNIFMGILGFNKSDLEATAIATLQPAQMACMVPMSIRAKNPNDQTLFGYSVYDIINNQNPTVDGTANATVDTQVSGAFNFANPLGSASANANTVSDWIKSYGVCNVPTVNGTCIDEIPTNGVTTAWNARFGLYGGGVTPQVALPDLTGVAYDYQTVKGLSTAINAYKDTDEPAKKPFQGGLTGGGYTWSQSNHLTYGATNRRLVGLPVVDGSKNCGSGGGHPIVGWACGLMLAPYESSSKTAMFRVQRIQILGRADKTAYCGTMGIPGGSNATGPLVPALVQ